jgi:hypothetical protein
MPLKWSSLSIKSFSRAAEQLVMILFWFDKSDKPFREIRR